jgi:hypothetical protein
VSIQFISYPYFRLLSLIRILKKEFLRFFFVKIIYYLSVEALCPDHTPLQHPGIFSSVRPSPPLNNKQTVRMNCVAVLYSCTLTTSNKIYKNQRIYLDNILIYRINLASLLMKYHSVIYMKLEDAMVCLSNRTSCLSRARKYPEDFKHAKLGDFNLLKVD